MQVDRQPISLSSNLGKRRKQSATHNITQCLCKLDIVFEELLRIREFVPVLLRQLFIAADPKKNTFTILSSQVLLRPALDKNNSFGNHCNSKVEDLLNNRRLVREFDLSFVAGD